jgi:hypothetical protein
MDDFETRYSLLKKDDLVSYLSSLAKPCYESELLKIVFANQDIMEVDSLTLYQNHFLLFNLLYELQNSFYEQGKYLHVHFMRTFLFEYPPHGKCKFFNEDVLSFCSETTMGNSEYCEFHKFQLENEIEQLSIKYFYLDRENFYRLDKETAESFINGTWEILMNYDDYKKSFEILELPESSDIETIKKQFKILAKKHHPDHGESSHKKFNEINRAYRLLIEMIPVFKKIKKSAD